MNLFYLIGEPGSGKTTLFRALTAGLKGAPVHRPVPHIEWSRQELEAPRAIELGKRDGVFSGTDRLSMSIQPVVIDWLELVPHRYVFAEGDRLANGKFFTAVTAMGWNLTVAVLKTPPEIAAERRASRGSNQDPKWLRGRQTKVKRLAEDWAEWEIDGTWPTDKIVEDLRFNEPVFKHLLGAPVD